MSQADIDELAKAVSNLDEFKKWHKRQHNAELLRGTTLLKNCPFCFLLKEIEKLQAVN